MTNSELALTHCLNGLRFRTRMGSQHDGHVPRNCSSASMTARRHPGSLGSGDCRGC